VCVVYFIFTERSASNLPNIIENYLNSLTKILYHHRVNPSLSARKDLALVDYFVKCMRGTMWD